MYPLRIPFQPRNLQGLHVVRGAQQEPAEDGNPSRGGRGRRWQPYAYEKDYGGVEVYSRLRNWVIYLLLMK